MWGVAKRGGKAARNVFPHYELCDWLCQGDLLLRLVYSVRHGSFGNHRSYSTHLVIRNIKENFK